MAKNEIESRLKLTAKDAVSATLKRISDRFSKLNKRIDSSTRAFGRMQLKTEKLRRSLAKTGKGMKRIGGNMTRRLSAPLIAVGAGIIKMSADFQSGMNRVEAISEATGKPLEKMTNLAKKLGSTTQFSATQAADAMAFLAQAGFSSSKILQSVPDVLNLAAASGIELSRAADIASNVMGGFGMKATQVGRISDVLAKTTSSSNVNMEMLAQSMKTAAPLAKQYGSTLEETAAAIGILGNAGIQGSDAGTAMKRVFLAMAAPTSKAGKILEKLEVKTSDSTGKLLGIGKVMKGLGKELADLPQNAKLRVLNDLFGKIGISGAAVFQEAAKSGAFDELNKKLNNAGGTAEKMRLIMEKGATGGVIKLKSAIEGLAIAIGDSGLLEFFTKVVTKITAFVSDLTKSNPSLLKWGTLIAGVAIVLGPLIFMVGAMAAIAPIVITAFTALVAFFGTPLVGVIGAVMVAVGALILLWNKLVEVWPRVTKAFKEFINPITKWVTEAFISMENVVGNFFNMIFKKLGGLKDKLVNALPSFIKSTLGIDSEDSENNSNVKNIIEDRTSGSKLLKPIRSAPRPLATNLVKSKSESLVVVDFKNAPKGTQVKTKTSKGSRVDMKLGFQGAGA